MPGERETFSELCANLSSGGQDARARFEREVVPLIEIVLRRVRRANCDPESLDASLAVSGRQAATVCRALVAKLVRPGRSAETIDTHAVRRFTRRV